VITFIAFVSSSCDTNKPGNQSVKEDDFLFQYMDTTVKPGDDFFKYATVRG
jgi:hypothetical protein